MFDNLGKKKLLKFNTQIRINGKEKSSNLAGYRILFSSRWKVLLCILYNNIFVFLKFLWNAKYLKIPSIRSVFNSTAYIFQHSLNSKFLQRNLTKTSFRIYALRQIKEFRELRINGKILGISDKEFLVRWRNICV